MADIRRSEFGSGDEASTGVGAMALAGGVLALLALLMSRALPGLPWMVLFPVLLGAGLGGIRGLLDHSAGRALFGLTLGGGAGFLANAGLADNAIAACAVFGALLGAYHWLDDRAPRLALSSVLTTGVLASVGAVFASALLAAPVLPEAIAIGLAGAAFGTAVGSGEALRLRPRDVVLRRYHRLRDAARGELGHVVEALVREYLKLERVLHSRALLSPAERRKLLRQVTELTEQILETAARECRLEQELGRVRPPDIDQRMAEVQRRLEASRDEPVRQQYGQALQNLQDQGRHYRELESARDRMLSRLTNFLTSLQSLYLALVSLEVAGHEGAPEGSDGGKLEQVIDEIEALRQVADEMSLRRRLEALPAEVRSLRPAD